MLRQSRDVAQLGSAPALGAGCRRFKSCHPDKSESSLSFRFRSRYRTLPHPFGKSLVLILSQFWTKVRSLSAIEKTLKGKDAITRLLFKLTRMLFYELVKEITSSRENSMAIALSILFGLTPIALTIHLALKRSESKAYKKRLGYIYGSFWAIALIGYSWLYTH